MRYITLLRGQKVQIDDCDFDFINRFKWRLSNRGYAVRYVRKEGHKSLELMHRVILKRMGYVLEDSDFSDHIDRNRLNNQRNNLRVATRSQNQANCKYIGISGFKGVKKVGNRWRSTIKHNGSSIHIGYFPTPEKAAHAYDAKATELFGEFATLNFPSVLIPSDALTLDAAIELCQKNGLIVSKPLN